MTTAAEYAAMYEKVRDERLAAGKADAPIMTAAEAMRRLRTTTTKPGKGP